MKFSKDRLWPIWGLLLSAFISNSTLAGTSELNRYKILEDRLRTEELIRPFGHDFLLNVNAAMSKNLLDTIDEAKKASDDYKKDNDLNIIKNFLNKYDKTEQFGFAKVDLGIPLPTFTAWSLKIVPDLRGYGNVGADFSLRSQPLSSTTIYLSDIPGIPSEILALAPNATLPTNLAVNADIVDALVTQGTIPAILAAPYLNKYFMPDFSLPNLNLYVKNDFRGILGFQYFTEKHFFGHLNFTHLTRMDKDVRINEQILRTDGKIVDMKKKNTQTSLQLDWKLGYKNDDTTAAISIEEIQLTKLTDKIKTNGDVIYKYDPIFRLHADTLYRFGILKLYPFLGVHKREGYSISDGMYAGAEGAVTVWGDRLFLALRTMMDKDYLTFTPNIRLWFMQAEFSFRKVLDDTTKDGNKVSNIMSANFRLFF